MGTGASAFTYTLQLLIPGSSNSLLPLSFTSVGNWSAGAQSPTDPTKSDQNYGLFAYGVPTLASAVPRTGTVRYRGFVFDGYNTPGELDLTIDYATGQVQGSVTPTFNDGAGGISSLMKFPFSGVLPAGTSAFRLTFPVDSPSRTGTLDVQLTGPAAEELMARWSATVVNPQFSTQPMLIVLPGAAKGS